MEAEMSTSDRTNVPATVTKVDGMWFTAMPDDPASASPAIRTWGANISRRGPNCDREVGDTGYLSYGGGPSCMVWSFHTEPR